MATLAVDARRAVASAMRSGVIVRETCIVPGCNVPGEVFQPNLARPLQVLWLCRGHRMLFDGRSRCWAGRGGNRTWEYVQGVVDTVMEAKGWDGP